MKRIEWILLASLYKPLSKPILIFVYLFWEQSEPENPGLHTHFASLH